MLKPQSQGDVFLHWLAGRALLLCLWHLHLHFRNSSRFLPSVPCAVGAGKRGWGWGDRMWMNSNRASSRWCGESRLGPRKSMQPGQAALPAFCTLPSAAHMASPSPTRFQKGSQSMGRGQNPKLLLLPIETLFCFSFLYMLIPPNLQVQSLCFIMKN